MKKTIVIYTRVGKDRLKQLTFRHVEDYEICKGFLSMTMKNGKIINYNLSSIELFEEIETKEEFTAMNPPVYD